MNQSLISQQRSTQPPRAFLSHSAANKAIVERLARDLRAQGVDVWYSGWELRPGDSLRRKIEGGIDGATHFIVLLTPESLASEWVQTELDGATIKRIDGTCRVIPVVVGVDPRDVPLFLRSIVWIPLDDYEAGLRRLVDACHGVDGRPPLGPMPLRLFSNAITAQGLSPDAASVAEWVNRQSPEGTPYDSFERDALRSDLGLSATAARDAVSELEDLGWVDLQIDTGSGAAGFSALEPKAALFWSTDPACRGWDPAKDAVALAAALMNVGDDRSVELATLAATLGWSPRRINPAASFLVDYGYVDGCSTLGTAPYVVGSVFANRRTGRFARGQE